MPSASMVHSERSSSEPRPQAGPELVQIMAVISDYVTQIVYRNTVGILSNIPLPGPRARKRRHHQLARRHAVASLE